MRTQAVAFALALAVSLTAHGCVCEPGVSDCEGQCTDLASSPLHCGACGNACDESRVCTDGACVCGPGRSSCSGACPDMSTDTANCGACGNRCPAAASCVSGACVCPTGLSVCGSACLDLESTESCGACDDACSVGASCVSGECQCPGAGPEVCGGVCTDLASDAASCGACDSPCATGASCTDFSCQCPVGQAICSGECTDRRTDEENCGSCGSRCAPRATCTAGRCICPGSETLCGGACVDTSRDDDHCGSCTLACGPGATCSASACHPRFAFAVPSPSDTSIMHPWDGAVTVDDAGNVTWAHSIERGAATVSQYGPDGSPRWTRALAGSSEGVGGVCAEPVTGRVGVVSSIYAPGGYDVYVRVLDPSAMGSTLWFTVIHSTGRTRPGGCAFSTTGQLSVGGQIEGTVDFAGTTFSGRGYGDGFLATYESADGRFVHVSQVGTDTTDDEIQVAATPDGDWIVTGAVGGRPLTLGSTTVRGTYAARLRSDGTVVWALDLPFDTSSVTFPAIGRPGVAPSGTVYVSGILHNGLSSARTYTLAGIAHPLDDRTTEMVVLAVDGTGRGLWAAGNQMTLRSPPDIAAGHDGRVYVVGTYYDSFGTSALPVTANLAAFVLALEGSSGRTAWYRVFDSPEASYGLDVSENASLLAIAGRADRSLDLGGGPVVLGNDDAWLAGYVP